MRWSEAGYLSQFVLSHALRQVSVSLILDVRQKKTMTSLSIFIPLVPVVIATLFCGAKLGLLTSRSFIHLAKELEGAGHPMTRETATTQLKTWSKSPEAIIPEGDSEGVKAIKQAHIKEFAPQIRTWKRAARLGWIGTGVAAFVILLIQK
jgi:hypothetical protein